MPNPGVNRLFSEEAHLPNIIKEQKRMQRTQRSFAKNAKELENVLFFCKRTRERSVLFSIYIYIYMPIYIYIYISACCFALVFLKQTVEFNHLLQKDRGKTASAARILSPNPTRRPLPCLLIQSFFYEDTIQFNELNGIKLYVGYRVQSWAKR